MISFSFPWALRCRLEPMTSVRCWNGSVSSTYSCCERVLVTKRIIHHNCQSYSRFCSIRWWIWINQKRAKHGKWCTVRDGGVLFRKFHFRFGLLVMLNEKLQKYKGEHVGISLLRLNLEKITGINPKYLSCFNISIYIWEWGHLYSVTSENGYKIKTS
jgi:hypothetical protein